MCTEEDRARMVRIESRLCQLMQHMGLDPHIHKYDEPKQEPPSFKHNGNGVWKQRDPK